MTENLFPPLVKRLLLGLLTLVTFLFVGASLLSSLQQQQIQSRLELYQTNLLLRATEWQSEQVDPNVRQLRDTVLGEDAYKAALSQYRDIRESVQGNLESQQLESIPPVAPQPSTPSPTVTAAGSVSEAQLLDTLDLRIGILQVKQGNAEAALSTWQGLLERETDTEDARTARVLVGLWSDPAKLLPEAEARIQQQLDGWFRDRALTRLYRLQERDEDLAQLQAREQQNAQNAAYKLALVNGLPTIGFFIGLGLLVFAIAQRLWKQKQSLLALNSDRPWEMEWDWETILQVLVVGFFFVGQLVVPLLLQIVKQAARIDVQSLGSRAQAFYILVTYILLATGGLSVLYLSLRPFFPLGEDWFRFEFKPKGLFWGLGGYFAAVPLVIVISLVNQQLWQGRGGSNPILPIALEGRDPVAILLFFVTASIAAPLFEEVMFRGFLLPSLTRYLPVWGAIAASSLLFAIAHLNLSEVLPLAMLGVVLGVVYTRSRNLIAPMLLHGLWNAATLFSLFILGSGSG